MVIASLWPLVSFPQRIRRSFDQIKMETACGLRWKFPLVPSPSQKFDLDSQSVSVKCHLTAPFSPNERNTRLLPFHFIIIFLCVCVFYLTPRRPEWKCFISVSHVNCTSHVIVCPLLRPSSLNSVKCILKPKPDSSW